MPVRTATLSHAAAPARLSRADRTAPARTGPRMLAMTAGALLLGASFAPLSWWWAAPIGIAALVMGVHGASLRSAAVLGAWAGAGFTLVSLGWLSSVGLDALAAVTVLMAGWWAGTMLAVRLVLPLPAWPLLVPAIWVLQEWVLGAWPFGGFPWSRLGYVSVDSPLSAAIPVVGVYGLTFVLALLGTALADALVHRRPTRSSVVATVLVVAIGVSGFALRTPDSPGEPVTVAVVQGGAQGGFGEQQARAVLAAHVARTQELASRRALPPAFVVWPESSSDIDPFTDSQARAQIDDAVAAVEAPVLVGAVTADPRSAERVLNQSISWLPVRGPTGAYTKRQLVPFGEYVPARDLLTRLSSRFDQVYRDFAAGTDAPVLRMSGVPVGVLICFEVAFDGSAREAIEQGATVLAVPSNNATYAGTTQPDQQLAIARFRAIETHRPVLVASTTGVSAVISSDGSVQAYLEDGESGALSEQVSPSSTVTPAVTWGRGIAMVLSLVALAAVAVGIRRPISSTRAVLRRAEMRSTCHICGG